MLDLVEQVLLPLPASHRPHGLSSIRPSRCSPPLLLFALQGSDWAEVVALAQALEAAGASIINTGIGWHEARIPTIATCARRTSRTSHTARSTALGPSV